MYKTLPRPQFSPIFITVTDGIAEGLDTTRCRRDVGVVGCDRNASQSQNCVMLKAVLTLNDFEVATTCNAPHDADVATTSCSVRPSAIPSVPIKRIGGYRSPS